MRLAARRCVRELCSVLPRRHDHRGPPCIYVQAICQGEPTHSFIGNVRSELVFCELIFFKFCVLFFGTGLVDRFDLWSLLPSYHTFVHDTAD